VFIDFLELTFFQVLLHYIKIHRKVIILPRKTFIKQLITIQIFIFYLKK